MIVWPSTLPKPNQNLSGDVRSQVVRTQMESGRTRQFSRFGNQEKGDNLTWTFTDAQFVEFQTFFRDTLAGGTFWFELPYPDGAGGFTTQTVRFVGGTFSRSYLAHLHWQVSAAIEQDIEEVETYVEPDIMPMRYQRVIEFTGANLVLDYIEHQNALIRMNSAVVDQTVTLPANAGFTDKFSCVISRIGLADVEFDGETDVILDSYNDYTRIFSTKTAVAVHYVGTNRFQIFGDLY
jgi:hypothetical protein